MTAPGGHPVDAALQRALPAHDAGQLPPARAEPVGLQRAHPERRGPGGQPSLQLPPAPQPAIARIAAEQLVGPLAADDDLDVPAGELGPRLGGDGPSKSSPFMPEKL